MTYSFRQIEITILLHWVAWFSLCPVAAAQPATATSVIALEPAPLPFLPKDYYIADVIDERENRSAIGYLLWPRTTATEAVRTYPVDLQGGLATGIRQFVRQSWPYQQARHPVVARILECFITEMPTLDGRVDGQVVLTISFDLQREDRLVHLVEYQRGGARYNRPAHSQSHRAVEQAFRRSVVGALRYLDTWMHQEEGGSLLFAKAIKVTITDYIENEHPDTVFYDPRRPLRWSDFRERPRLEKFAASVFPTFGYESRSEMTEGVLHIHITLKVYMLPKYSWVKDHARDAYSLNHEQRHFDIAKLVAERFKLQIQPDSLSAEDHKSILHWKYLDAYREMNRLQEQYDDETSHGTNTVAQARWNKYVDKALGQFAVKEPAQ